MLAARTSSLRSAAVMFAALTLAGGCTLGPNYERPAIDVGEQWRDPVATPAEQAAERAGNFANTPWWELFRDEKLHALIRIALVENQDLRIAVERIVEARARVGFVRADLFPKVDLAGNAGYFENSREAFPNNPKPNDNDAPLYGIALDVTWELDVFGRIRRSTESERALLLATEEGQRAVTIALVAAVATNYVELSDADLRLEIARRTLESRQRSLDLARVRFRGGLTSEIDSRQAEAEYRRVEVAVLQFEQLVRERENALSILLGRRPAQIARSDSFGDLTGDFAIPAGLPSELLDRRPDLRQAEAVLHSFTANIGAAKALLFPRIALTADIGTVSTELDALFTGSSAAWSVAAGLVQPIFNAGKNLRRVQIAESQMRQTLYEYEKTVLQALREVEDSLVAWSKTSAQRGAQRERVVAELKVVELSTVRYDGGVADYLEVLDAQRSLFSAELDEVSTISEQAISLIQLYKALGGGWPATNEVASASDARKSESKEKAP